MPEKVGSEHKLDIQFQGNVYEVTDMAGYSIEYLKTFLVQNGLSVKDAKVTIFSAGPNESDPSAILGKTVGVLPQGMVDGKFRILQGVAIKVTDKYVLSEKDLIVDFSE